MHEKWYETKTNTMIKRIEDIQKRSLLLSITMNIGICYCQFRKLLLTLVKHLEK